MKGISTILQSHVFILRRVSSMLLLVVFTPRITADDWVPVRAHASSITATSSKIWAAWLEDTEGQGPLLASSATGASWQETSNVHRSAKKYSYGVTSTLDVEANADTVVLAVRDWYTGGDATYSIHIFSEDGTRLASFGGDPTYGIPVSRLFRILSSVYGEHSLTVICPGNASLVRFAGPATIPPPIPGIYRYASCADCNPDQGEFACMPGSVFAAASNGTDTFVVAEYDPGNGDFGRYLLRLDDMGWSQVAQLESVTALETLEGEIYAAGVFTASPTQTQLARWNGATWVGVDNAVSSSVQSIIDIEPFGSLLLFSARHAGDTRYHIYAWDGAMADYWGAVPQTSSRNGGKLAATSENLFILGDQVYRRESKVDTKSTSLGALRSRYE